VQKAALTALRYDVVRVYYARLVDDGTRPERARVSVARKLAACALTVWQRRAEFDLNQAFAQH
jgi:hypothetical protein